MPSFFLPRLFSLDASGAAFDPRTERSRMAEVVVRSAASLVASDDGVQAPVEEIGRAHV